MAYLKKLYSYLYLYKINQSGKFTIHCTVVDCIECTLHFSLSKRKQQQGFEFNRRCQLIFYLVFKQLVKKRLIIKIYFLHQIVIGVIHALSLKEKNIFNWDPAAIIRFFIGKINSYFSRI